METVAVASAGALRRRVSAPSRADLVELRLDALEDPRDPAAFLRDCPQPAIATCRPRWEGGGFDGSEEARERLLGQALDAGAAYVDVEWAAACRHRMLARAPERVVVSLHAFDGVPSDLEARVAAMAATPAAVVKVAVQATRLRDLLPLVAMGDRLARRRPMVLIAMGAAGLGSRIDAARIGSVWTYAG